MLNGLDLFSGIGGLSIALGDWVLPKAYCESDRYAQSVLLSRMSSGQLYQAPIWDDVKTLTGKRLPKIDVVYGGFPCQDISAAGNGVGLGGERSGLFFHIARLVQETNPRFIFLENVPAIRTRGLNSVVQTLTELGYDCRWTVVSAAELGAPHLRKRWFLLAHSNRDRSEPGIPVQTWHEDQGVRPLRNGEEQPVADSEGVGSDQGRFTGRTKAPEPVAVERREVANSSGVGLEEPRGEIARSASPIADSGWWVTEPDVGRVANGVQHRVDRIRGLGNAVVPLQAKTAFERLMGFK